MKQSPRDWRALTTELVCGMETLTLEVKRGDVCFHWDKNFKAEVLALLTDKLLALQALVQPLGSHNMPHHGHGRQELDRARHLAGDQVRALVRRLGNVAPENVELLKAETETGVRAGAASCASCGPEQHVQDET